MEPLEYWADFCCGRNGSTFVNVYNATGVVVRCSNSSLLLYLASFTIASLSLTVQCQSVVFNSEAFDIVAVFFVVYQLWRVDPE